MKTINVVLTQKAELTQKQFDQIFAENAVVSKFSNEAKKIIFNKISEAQKQGDERDFLSWFINAKEMTSAEVYELHSEVVDGMGGPLLDLLHDNHKALFDKTGIDFSDDDDTVTDISLLEDNHDILVADEAFMAATINYINEALNHPCIALRNGKWLCLWRFDKEYKDVKF